MTPLHSGNINGTGIGIGTGTGNGYSNDWGCQNYTFIYTCTDNFRQQVMLTNALQLLNTKE